MCGKVRNANKKHSSLLLKKKIDKKRCLMWTGNRKKSKVCHQKHSSLRLKVKITQITKHRVQ